MAQQKTTKSTRMSTQRKPAETKATYTEEQLQLAIAKAVQEALAASAEKTSCAAIQVVPEEKVTLMYIGGMARGFSVKLCNLGRITIDCGLIEEPKKLFLKEANLVAD